MGNDVLGGFEHQVLLAMMRVEGPAYSIPIMLELEGRTGRTVSASAVYIALRRLERRGLVTSRMARLEGTGGKPRRVFELQEAGLEQLRESKRMLGRLWHGLEALEGG